MPRWPLIIGGLVALLSITASVTRTIYAYYQTAPLKPMIMRQPAQGLTDADITPKYAEEVRESLISQTNAKIPEGTGEVGGGSAAVMTVGDRRFGVVLMAANGIESVVTVFGIRGDELVRVTCIEEDVADYRTPECASAIRGALDVQLP